MPRSKNHSLQREAAKHYVTVKALKDHFNLNWGDIDRIVKAWKEANPKPGKEEIYVATKTMEN